MGEIKFAKPEYRPFYPVVETPAVALDSLVTFVPPPAVSKWKQERNNLPRQ